MFHLWRATKLGTLSHWQCLIWPSPNSSSRSTCLPVAWLPANSGAVCLGCECAPTSVHLNYLVYLVEARRCLHLISRSSFRRIYPPSFCYVHSASQVHQRIIFHTKPHFTSKLYCLLRLIYANDVEWRAAAITTHTSSILVVLPSCRLVPFYLSVLATSVGTRELWKHDTSPVVWHVE